MALSPLTPGIIGNQTKAEITSTHKKAGTTKVYPTVLKLGQVDSLLSGRRGTGRRSRE
jgi:hypothetical protein